MLPIGGGIEADAIGSSNEASTGAVAGYIIAGVAVAGLLLTVTMRWKKRRQQAKEGGKFRATVKGKKGKTAKQANREPADPNDKFASIASTVSGPSEPATYVPTSSCFAPTSPSHATDTDPGIGAIHLDLSAVAGSSEPAETYTPRSAGYTQNYVPEEPPLASVEEAANAALPGQPMGESVPPPPSSLPMSTVALSAEVEVPEGAVPGEDFSVQLDDGREVVVNCPVGAGPGDVLEIDVPGAEATDSEVDMSPFKSIAAGDDDDDDNQPTTSMETAEVTVPAECRPGDSFVVEASWGGLFEVEVPPGTVEGSTLFVELPLPPADGAPPAPPDGAAMTYAAGSPEVGQAGRFQLNV